MTDVFPELIVIHLQTILTIYLLFVSGSAYSEDASPTVDGICFSFDLKVQVKYDNNFLDSYSIDMKLVVLCHLVEFFGDMIIQRKSLESQKPRLY